ncbi:MAG: hypothetical protein HN826_03585 [Methylococcales bacterium]|jgi:hypothetical protein|nr:hypothetical protein [Methylococcales bacterium]
MKKILIIALLILAPLTVFSADRLTGHACYHYSDNESLLVARQLAISLAKREILEQSSTFVESTSTVENFSLKNDLITSLSGGVLKNIKVTLKTESVEKREVCRTITAEIEPVEFKKKIQSSLRAFKRKHSNNYPTGLPKNAWKRILKVKEKGSTIIAIAECLKTHDKYSYGIRVIYYDEDGIPEESSEPSKNYCWNVGDIVKAKFPRKAKQFSAYGMDIVETGKK